MEFEELNRIPTAVLCFKNISSDTENSLTNIYCNETFKQLSGHDYKGMDAQKICDEYGLPLVFIKSEYENQKEKIIVTDKNHKELSLKIKSCGEIFYVCVDVIYKNRENDSINTILNSLASGVVIADKDENIEFINKSARETTGFDTFDAAPKINELLKTEANDSVGIENKVEKLLVRGDKKKIPVSLNKLPLDYSNSGSDTAYIIENLSEVYEYRRQIQYLKSRDVLTGLYNRAYFERIVSTINYEKAAPFSVIIGDINGLKMINDVFGKQRGDQMLLTVANIFTLACHDNDIIARFGGDTFVVALPNTTLDEAEVISHHILNLCSTENSLTSKISVSLGFSCNEDGKKSFDDTLNVAEDYMCRHKMLENKSYRSSFIASLKSMLYDKSYETEKHALRITSLCEKVGSLMNLSEIDMNDLGLFSMLHDIGKIGVEDRVLSKPGKLTQEEWQNMRKHSFIGYKIARSSPELESIANDILCHHERFDGKGYPNGLKGENIPLLARILSVADAYDAMVNDRCYRKAMPKEDAIAEIKRCSGTQFDPEIVKVFLKAVE